MKSSQKIKDDSKKQIYKSKILPTSELLNEWFSGEIVPEPANQQNYETRDYYNEYSVYVKYADS